MSATPIVYSSVDASAPVLDGTSGALLALLRAILVTGYGAKTAAGWSEPFATAGNVATFRNDHLVGTGAYYRFDDNNVSSAKSATVRGYKNMTGLSTGTDTFPTVGQEAAGLYVRKSTASGSTARDWWAIACRKWIYLFVDANSVGSVGIPYFFGDIDSMRPSDAYSCAITGGRIADPAVTAHASLFMNNCSSASTAPAGTNTGMYVAGTYNQVASSTGVLLVSPYGIATLIGGSNGYSYPHPVNTGLLFGRVIVNEASYVARGWMPAFYAPWHNNPGIGDLTTLPNVPAVGMNSVNKRWSPRADGALGGEVIFDLTTTH